MHPLQSRAFVDKLMETQGFMRFIEERTFPSTRSWEFVFFDQCIDTGVHDPPANSGRQRVFSVPMPDPERLGAMYSYRVFHLDETLFHLPGDEIRSTPIVSLDTITVEEMSQDANLDSWFLMYCSFTRRRAELLAQSSATSAVYVDSTVEPTRQQRLAALQQRRQEVDLRRTDEASKGLHVSFDVKKYMHEQAIHVNERCYRSLMEICGYGKLSDAAKLVFEDMKNHNVVPDTISYNAFVQAIIRAEDEVGATKFKSNKQYSCVDTTPTDGRGVSAQDEAVTLAIWAAQGTSYDDWCCLPPLRLSIEKTDASGAVSGSFCCSFVSPFTLMDELEGLLAHWTDSLLTIVESPPSQMIRLRQEHPTAFWCAVWFFHNLKLPTNFLLPERIEQGQIEAQSAGLAEQIRGVDASEMAKWLACLPKMSGSRSEADL